MKENTVHGIPVVFDEELGKDLKGPPVVFGPPGGIWTPQTGIVTAFKRGKCPVCGGRDRQIAAVYSDKTSAGEACVSCIFSLTWPGGFKMAGVRIRQASAVGSVVGARLTTDPT